jgi:hypothetical protein
MRQFTLIAVFSLFSISMFTGCFPTASSVAPSYGMTATIGSTHLNATVVNAYSTMNILAITGSSVNGSAAGRPQINITVPNWNGAAGTFTLMPGMGGTFNGPFAEYIPTDSSYALLSQHGTVVVNSVSTSTITGTFSFTCTDSTAVTAGSFIAKRY